MALEIPRAKVIQRTFALDLVRVPRDLPHPAASSGHDAVLTSEQEIRIVDVVPPADVCDLHDGTIWISVNTFSRQSVNQSAETR